MALCTFVSPQLVVQKSDPMTTGIVYMPILLAYAVSQVRESGRPVHVVDSFGESPHQVIAEENFYYYGLDAGQVADRVGTESIIVFVYALNLMSHSSVVTLIKEIRRQHPEVTICVLENTQAVTAYALEKVAQSFYEVGANHVLTGESESRILPYIEAIEGKRTADLVELDGIGGKGFFSPAKKKIKDIDKLPYPAWDLFPLQNYWGLKFAHGPLQNKRYLPLLTSRGCPYVCSFCVVPKTNNRRWRPRSAKSVVDEIEYFNKQYGVSEFHWEDLDPTISDDRIRAICQLIIKRNLQIKWKLCSGTKVETIKNSETIALMAKAGCSYVSISPESGSKKILKAMRKMFDSEHAHEIVRAMHCHGIKSQACFVLGFPGEKQDDVNMTFCLAKSLVKSGIDEIAVFIISPVPGSQIFEQFSGYSNLSQLNFSPTWREDYPQLAKIRLRLYRKFLIWKCFYHPFKVCRQVLNFVTRRFETKMEMVPYRAMVLLANARKAGI